MTRRAPLSALGPRTVPGRPRAPDGSHPVDEVRGFDRFVGEALRLLTGAECRRAVQDEGREAVNVGPQGDLRAWVVGPVCERGQRA